MAAAYNIRFLGKRKCHFGHADCCSKRIVIFVNVTHDEYFICAEHQLVYGLRNYPRPYPRAFRLHKTLAAKKLHFTSHGNNRLIAAPAQKDGGTFVHRVVAGDRLRIGVAEQSDLGGVYAVAGDGTIDFGFIGRITVADMTVSEAADMMERLLEEKYFKEATVAVEIQDFVEGSILVMGAVQKPNAIPFSGGQIMTLMEALSHCGGLDRNAAGKEVRILRWKVGGGMERQTITVDVQSMIDTLDFGKDQYLRPRDIVFVPTLGGSEGVSEYLALGDFTSPGFHPYTENLDVIRAVTRAGGVSRDARWVRPVCCGPRSPAITKSSRWICRGFSVRRTCR